MLGMPSSAHQGLQCSRPFWGKYDFANEIPFDTWVLIPFTLRLSSSSSVKLLYWSIMHLAMLRYLSINNYNCDVKITTSVGRRIKIEKNGRVWPGGRLGMPPVLKVSLCIGLPEQSVKVNNESRVADIMCKYKYNLPMSSKPWVISWPMTKPMPP